MATTTRAAARQILSENIGDHFSSTATTNGTTTTIIDTALLSYAGLGGDDNGFINWYILVTESGHGALGEIRQVKSYDFDGTPGELTLEAALTAAVNSGQAYELHRYDPRHKHVALNRGVEEINGVLFLPIIDETLVVNDILTNSDFETFSSGFTGWTEVGSPTVTAETTIVFHGTNSAKVVASGADGQLTQTPTINVHEITNQTAEFWARVYATATSAGRIRIDFGSEIVSGKYHSGDDEWQLLKLSVSVPDAATQVKGILEATDGTTVYFDASRLDVGDKHRYTIPTAITELNYVEQQQDEQDETDYDEIPVRPWPLRRLRLTGKGILTEFTTVDTSTVEIGDNQINLLCRYAQVQLWEIIAALAAEDDKADYIRMAERAERRYEILRDRALGQTPQGAQNRRGVWHDERDASGYYLEFDNLPRVGITLRSHGI